MEVVDFQEMTFISGSGVRFISPTTNNDVHYYFYARLKVTVTGISDTDIKMCCSSRPLFLTLVFFEYLSPLLHLCTLHIMAWKTDAMSRTKKNTYWPFLASQPHDDDKQAATSASLWLLPVGRCCSFTYCTKHEKEGQIFRPTFGPNGQDHKINTKNQF